MTMPITLAERLTAMADSTAEESGMVPETTTAWEALKKIEELAGRLIKLEVERQDRVDLITTLRRHRDALLETLSEKYQ